MEVDFLLGLAGSAELFEFLFVEFIDIAVVAIAAAGLVTRGAQNSDDGKYDKQFLHYSFVSWQMPRSIYLLPRKSVTSFSFILR